MVIVDPLRLDRLVEYVRVKHEHESVSDEMRGWSWEALKPIYDVYLSVSEVANRYCPTYRDIYLKRVERVRAPYTFKTVRGLAYHYLYARSLSLAKSILYNAGVVSGYKLLMESEKIMEDIVREALKHSTAYDVLNKREVRILRRDLTSLYRYIFIQIAGMLDRYISETRFLTKDRVESIVYRVIPDLTEVRVDGSRIGLSNELYIDILRGNVVADIKTGDIRDFHRLTVAGYALALESDRRIPIDIGLVIYLSVVDGHVKYRVESFFIGDELRQDFIETRDEAAKIVYRGRDPGKPVKCPSYCIYYSFCNG